VPRRGLSRRQFLYGAGGLVGLGLAGLGGYESPSNGALAGPGTETGPASPEVYRFVTAPELRAQVVNITHYLPSASQDSSPRFIFLAPKAYYGPAPGQPGPMIVDRNGRLVWFNPVNTVAFDLNVQSLDGRPVLTWWQGLVNDGYGRGTAQIAGTSYDITRTAGAGDGLLADLHEFNLTSSGTALLTAYEVATADLSAIGGSRNGTVLAGHAQEVDLRTGKVLFDWRSLDHVGVDESYKPTAAQGGEVGAYDYFHINSVAETADGNLLISARNTWTVYKVDRGTGQVLWRLNGKRSDFTMGTAAHFYWQHDAREVNGGVTLFDNNGTAPSMEKQSRALVLSVDTRAMHVDLAHAYVLPARFLSATQGSTQLLADGRVFVGWGSQPYFSEFAPDGTLLLEGQLPLNIQSYRAHTHDWSGVPAGVPSVAVLTNPAGGVFVYVSWNGATEIFAWTVLAGEHPSRLEPVGWQRWGGFETAVAVNSAGPYFAAVAVDKTGKHLGRSAILEVLRDA
jgi:outer membrane protein assembly factor BamB